MHVFVTGASGFVGRSVVDELIRRGYNVSVLVRQRHKEFPSSVKQIVGDLCNLHLSLEDTLSSVECIVHLAGIAASNEKRGSRDINSLMTVNCDATLSLARMAIECGVKRFIFLSSVKINGSKTTKGIKFGPESAITPDDSYSYSKYKAEHGLSLLSAHSDMESVVIRAPLIYGPNVKGNFSRILGLVEKSPLLPLASINNERSLLAVENAVDFILLCVDRCKSLSAANQVFYIADPIDISLSTLIKKIIHIFEFRCVVFPFPISVINFVLRGLGKEHICVRLLANLQVDSTKANEMLGWEPPVSLDEQLLKMANVESGDEQ